MTKKEFVETLISGWGSNVVARSRVSEFSGGAISGRTVANRESEGDKVPGRTLLGRQIIYPTRGLAEWIARNYIKNDGC